VVRHDTHCLLLKEAVHATALPLHAYQPCHCQERCTVMYCCCLALFWTAGVLFFSWLALLYSVLCCVCRTLNSTLRMPPRARKVSPCSNRQTPPPQQQQCLYHPVCNVSTTINSQQAHAWLAGRPQCLLRRWCVDLYIASCTSRHTSLCLDQQRPAWTPPLASGTSWETGT
jgi:hypothetical protein